MVAPILQKENMEMKNILTWMEIDQIEKLVYEYDMYIVFFYK